MAEAIFGLIGVVVGGLLTGGTHLFIEWRRERADLRGACRVVAGELLLNAVHMTLAAQNHQWRVLKRNSRARYEEFELTLSRHLAGGDAQDLASAYLAVGMAEMAADAVGWRDELFSDEHWKMVVDGLTTVRAGLDALIRYTAIPARGQPDLAIGLGEPPSNLRGKTRTPDPSSGVPPAN